MDAKRWGNLPQDLVRRVLARLPLPSLARARTVCKKWYTMVQTCHFLRLRKEIHCTPEAYLLLYWDTMNRDIHTFNASSKSWQLTFNLSFVPFVLSVPPIAGSGGLFCFACTESLLVCNLLTRRWRLLPPLLGFKPTLNPWTFAHLVLNHARMSYKIIIGRYEYSHLGHRPSNFRIKIFDSSSGAWQTDTSPTTPPLEVSLRGSVGINSQSLSGLGTTSQVLNGILYCLDNEWRHVMAFDVEKGSWNGEHFLLPRCFRSTWFPPCLLEHRGRLRLVGAAEDVHGDVSSRLIIVHELAIESKEWTELLLIPHEPCKELVTAPYIYKCFLHDDYMCFVTKAAGVLYKLRDGLFSILPMKFYSNNNSSLLYLGESTVEPLWNLMPWVLVHVHATAKFLTRNYKRPKDFN